MHRDTLQENTEKNRGQYVNGATVSAFTLAERATVDTFWYQQHRPCGKNRWNTHKSVRPFGECVLMQAWDLKEKDKDYRNNKQLLC